MDDKQITSIVKNIATANLSSDIIKSVLLSQGTDSTGNTALLVTIVLTPGSSEKVSGEAALDTLVSLRKALTEKGEERFPIVEYATEDELVARAD
jgi:hypothetical protein